MVFLPSAPTSSRPLCRINSGAGNNFVIRHDVSNRVTCRHVFHHEQPALNLLVCEVHLHVDVLRAAVVVSVSAQKAGLRVVLVEGRCEVLAVPHVFHHSPEPHRIARAFTFREGSASAVLIATGPCFKLCHANVAFLPRVIKLPEIECLSLVTAISAPAKAHSTGYSSFVYINSSDEFPFK